MADNQPSPYHTLHGSLKRVDGVDLHDDDMGPEAPQGLGTALAHVTIARYHRHLARNHHVRGPLDAIYEGLPAAIEVVKLALKGEGARRLRGQARPWGLKPTLNISAWRALG